jgi:peptide/nickel transport system ATP-binding protein
MPTSLLDVQQLTTSFTVGDTTLTAIEDVTFSVQSATTVALVGESGCGKSVTALSILGLVQTPPGHIDAGRVLFNGLDLLTLDDKALRKVRGNRIAMIFQEPMTSLNPVFTVGTQVAEGLILHQNLTRGAARQRTLELLQAVGIPGPEQRIDAYPHQLSGGMRQRVMIAMALACSPDLLIADEPTTALDVTIQAQILELLSTLQKQFSMSVLLITHDLGIVAQHADEVIVMYAGRVVETARVGSLFASPKHPYTAGLLASVPAHALSLAADQMPVRLPTIEGVVPASGQYSRGCRFSERCAQRQLLGSSGERCDREEPEIRQLADNRSVRCHFPLEDVSATN